MSEGDLRHRASVYREQRDALDRVWTVLVREVWDTKAPLLHYKDDKDVKRCVFCGCYAGHYQSCPWFIGQAAPEE